MTITPVQSAADARAFLDLVDDIYATNPSYIRPLDKDVEAVFNRTKNKYFRHGDAQRWLLRDAAGKVIGRVAAFVSDKYDNQHKDTGGMGFFECIDNREAAFLLFDTCKKWLREKGMRYMDGPINFGEKDKFWGLTTVNFDQPPYYGQNYTQAYYEPFFRAYGFQTFYRQLIYRRRIQDKLQPKFQERANRLKNEPGFEVRSIEKKHLEQYTEDFRNIYNDAWGKREGDKFVGMNQAQSRSIMKAMKPIMDEDLCCFAYYNNKPVGFFIGLPEVNQIFKRFNGKFGWWQKLRFLYHIKTGGCTTCFGLAFGITPEFQGKGVEGLLFEYTAQRTQKRGRYQDVIITWLGDFNIKMIKIIEALGGQITQEMETLRCPFTEGETISRHKINQ